VKIALHAWAGHSDREPVDESNHRDCCEQRKDTMALLQRVRAFPREADTEEITVLEIQLASG
jgi:hypothetical protein